MKVMEVDFIRRVLLMMDTISMMAQLIAYLCPKWPDSQTMEVILDQEHIMLISPVKLRLNLLKEPSNGPTVNQKGQTFSLELILNKMLDQDLTTSGPRLSTDQSIILPFQDKPIKQGLLSVSNQPES